MKPPLFTWLAMPHLPQVPEEFIILARELLTNTSQENSSTIKQGYTNSEFQKRLIKRNGHTLPTVYTKTVKLGDKWNQWLQDNNFPNFFDSTARVTQGLGDTFGPHVDNPGRVRLFYLIDRGGDNAETVWYHLPGNPVVYDMDNHNSSTIIHHNNVDELTVLDRAKFPLKSWALFNGWIMHGVENVTETRMFITVDMRPDAFDFQLVAKKSFAE